MGSYVSMFNHHQFSTTVWGKLGGVALWEEVCHWRLDYEVSKAHATLGMVAHAFNPSTWETEGGGFPSFKAGHFGLDITSSKAGLYWKSLDGSGLILPTPGLRQGELELALWSWLGALGCVSNPRFHIRLICLP